MELFIKRTLETNRLILCRREDSDAEDLYKYASDPYVGPIAGWPAHQSIDESREVIKKVLSSLKTRGIRLITMITIIEMSYTELSLSCPSDFSII